MKVQKFNTKVILHSITAILKHILFDKIEQYFWEFQSYHNSWMSYGVFEARRF